MFDLSSSRNVVITSLDIYTDDIRSDAIEVYTRSGSYSGHEVNETGWMLIYNKTVSQQGRFNLTKLGDFEYETTIQGGDTHAFYIYSENTIMYDTGTEEGAVSNNDTSLIIYEGMVPICYITSCDFRMPSNPDLIPLSRCRYCKRKISRDSSDTSGVLPKSI